VLAQAFCEDGEDEFSRAIVTAVIDLGDDTSAVPHVAWKGDGSFSSSFGVCMRSDVPVAKVPRPGIPRRSTATAPVSDPKRAAAAGSRSDEIRAHRVILATGFGRTRPLPGWLDAAARAVALPRAPRGAPRPRLGQRAAIHADRGGPPLRARAAAFAPAVPAPTIATSTMAEVTSIPRLAVYSLLPGPEGPPAMIIDWLLVTAGLLLLVGGGEGLVRGASGIALLARVAPAVVGLTIVAAGTSMPELVVSVQAALAGTPGMAMGNVVGSNLFNIGAILGLTALVLPLRIQGNTVRLEWPVMMLAAFQLHLLARDSTIDRLEGGFLLVAMVVFFAYATWVGRKNATAAEQQEFEEVTTASFGRTGTVALLFNIGAVLVGAGLLAGGSTLLVMGAVGLASAMGISDTIIGLTIVSAGTSTPELVTSLVAAKRGKDDIAVTNIVGSNIFNVLAIIGTSSLILPLEVPAEIIARDDWWMIGASLLLFPLMYTGMRVRRAEGAILLAGYVVYTVLLIGSAR
jgi:cation:H+ antiporter